MKLSERAKDFERAARELPKTNRYGLSASAVAVALPTCAGTLAGGLMALVLTGCGTGPAGPLQTTAPVTPAVAKVTGRVHGGQQPVSGAAIRLYTPGTGGYGTAATSMLTGSGYVLTDGNGGFTITGMYTCPSPSAQVYLAATGGNSGAGANPAIALVAALGSCQTLSASTYIQINELTTVAAAYALSGFGSSTTQISSSGSASALTGLANAFSTAASLVNYSTGDVPAAASRVGSIPVAEIYSLGDILAACVNSSVLSYSACQTLFADTTPGSGTAPTDTFQSAMNLAKAPASHASDLFMLASSAPPFSPGLSSAPSDWTIAITYTGGGLNIPQALGADASGNIWVVNASNTVTALAAGSGAFLSGTSGYTGLGLDAPSGLAIDTAGNVWISNCGDSCSQSGSASFLTKLTSSGTQVSGSPYLGGGLAGAYAVAVDGNNAAWVANVYGNSLSKFTSAGAASSGTSGFASGSLKNPLGVTIDASGNAWTVEPTANGVAKLTSAGAVGGGPYTGGGLSYPEALAIDHSGNVWVASHDGSNLVEVSSSGSILSGSAGFTGGGLAQPNAVAIDGSGNVYVANGLSNGGISAFTNAGVATSESTGYAGSQGYYPNGVAVDGSGNVWMTNCGSYCSGSGSSPGSVIEFVGLGSPVVTPLSVGVANNSLGNLP